MSKRILLKNGWLADGTGSPLRKENILVEGDSIAAMGALDSDIEAHVVDCTNLIAAPGLIDAHSHSDLQVLSNRPEKLLQGVTAEVVGNCGFSPYPNKHPDQLRSFANGILAGDDLWGWKSASDYLLEVQAKTRLASIASLLGHGSLRVAHAGLDQGPVSETVLGAMESTLDEALADGACGFSTGLMYAPGSSAPAEELQRLCRVVAKRDKIYCSHIRDYSTHLLEAIDEQVELARLSGCRLQISHLQAVGQRNWGLNSLALERIEAARRSGIDIMFDCYPYVAGSTVLTQLLPQWTMQGGIGTLTERLNKPESRRKIAAETMDHMVHQWSEIYISSVGSADNSDVVGKSLAEIAQERGADPLEVVFDLLVEERGQVNMLQFNQSDENLRANLTHPLSIIISDGFYVKGKPHPRLHGTFPELLGNVCREKHWLPLVEALHKVTGAPAERFSIERRGRLKQGYFADITIFDPEKIASRSTYDDPQQLPEGVRGVIREGEFLLWDGALLPAT